MIKPPPDTPDGREFAEGSKLEFYALLRDEGVVKNWKEFNDYIDKLVRQANE